MPIPSKNLLHNTFAQVGIVIVISAIILGTLMLRGTDEKTATATSTSESFETLMTVVKNYQSAGKWDEGEYNRTRQKIDNSFANGKIDGPQKKQLQNFVLSVYVGTLKAAIDRYLPTANEDSGPRINEFNAALSRLGSSAKGLGRELKIFTDMVHLEKEIDDYTRLEPYDFDLMNNFQNRATRFETTPLISNNTYLHELQDDYLIKLEEHKKIDETFNQSYLPGLKTDPISVCEFFKEKNYLYYYKACIDGKTNQ